MTKTAVGVLRDAKAEGQARSPQTIADEVLSRFVGVPDIDHYRARLEQFVRDIDPTD